jgi:sucrose synthase
VIEIPKGLFKSHRELIALLIRSMGSCGKKFLLKSEIWDIFKSLCQSQKKTELLDSELAEFIKAAQEAAIEGPWIYFAVRLQVAKWDYFRCHADTIKFEQVSVSDYLAFKERLVNGRGHEDEWTLEIDLGPFNRDLPRMHEQKSIGKGVEFLNRKLSSQLFDKTEAGRLQLIDFLRVHKYKERQLMLNSRVNGIDGMRKAIRRAESFLSKQPAEAGWESVEEVMRDYGFEPGWGKSVERIRDTLSLLSDILEAPAPTTLQEFLGRIPMIFSIVIVSPHGYFSQANVLGLPDTGGQVVYILDQVRAIEKEMINRLSEQGFDVAPEIVVVTRLLPDAQGTTCDQAREHIIGTKNARVVRVPFRDDDGEVVPQWISRFEIWPYLEKFAVDAEKEVVAELNGRPDLIIGNYSDGNLVASLLSQRLGVTQCNIAHALEKTKYLYSDLYWRENDDKYHFSTMFTADLISMNTADFIITSTYQEIAGDLESIGQYESYQSFTMPGLYRVINGINAYDPKFNIVSPGADSDTYFPYSESDRRLANLHEEIKGHLFGRETGDDYRGVLKDIDKPVIYTIARMDRIKNVSGLVELYGRSKALREEANLVIVSGYVNPGKSSDAEEKEQIQKMHDLFDSYKLDSQVRWCGIQLKKVVTGEIYRFVADTGGVFVQPALFEAFGLTVIEGMISGLPTFATCYGGPREIIKDGVSGFHINPNYPEEAAEKLVLFFKRAREEDGYWKSISSGGIDRVRERYTWDLYAERIMTFSRIYGFWKYVTNLEHSETRRYLEMLYGLQLRKLIEKMER